MIVTFDILKLQSSGLRWLESAPDLGRAEARVQALGLSFPGEYLIFCHEIEKKRIFQIGDEERQLKARAELFQRFGHEVISFSDYDAAKTTLLSSIPSVDMFIVGHSGAEKTRREMVRWLKTNYPDAKVVALTPSATRPIAKADYNLVLDGKYEWLSLMTAVAMS